MHLPKQATPIDRRISTVRTVQTGDGIYPAQATPEEIDACMSRCSTGPNASSRAICRALCRDL
jgi:hypothetical protein